MEATSTPATTRSSARPSSTSWSGSSVFPVFRSPGSASRWSCWSSRSSSARSTGRRSCGAASSDIRVAQPEPYFDPRLPDRAAMDGVPADGVRGVLRRQRVPGPRGDRRRRHALPLRRPPPVHEDGDAVHPPRADPLPRRGRGHVAARRRAGPRRRRGRVADGPADRHARPAAGQEPRLRGARLRDRPGRPTSRPTSPSTRTARRSPARRSGSTTRCRSAATRSTRTGSGRRRTSSSATPAGGRCGTRPCR